jgi:hypothetical protein
MNLIYPVSTEVLAIARLGYADNRRLSGSVESISVNMGDPSGDVKESGSSRLETTSKSSDALEGSQRGHSSRRAGKPSTWPRATACQVRQSTTPPLYTSGHWLGGGRKRR